MEQLATSLSDLETLAPDDPAKAEMRDLMGLSAPDPDQAALDASLQREAQERALRDTNDEPANDEPDPEEEDA